MSALQTGESGEMLEKLSMILLSETCPRMVLFSIMGQIGGMIILYWMLGKPRKQVRYISYMFFKAVFMIYFTYGLNLYYPGELWSATLQTAVSSVLGVVTMFLMIATYQNESLKVIFAALLGEIYFTLVEMLAVVGVNGLEGKTDLLLIYDRLQPMDLLIPVLFGTGIVLLKLFGGRWLARYRDVRIRHRQLFWFAIVAYFIVAQTNGMIVIGQEAGLVTATGMPFIGIAVLLVVLLGLVYRDYRRQVRGESRFLSTQFQLLQTHYESIRTQMQRMEMCQKLVDKQMKEIVRRGEDVAATESCDRCKDTEVAAAKGEEMIKNGISEKIDSGYKTSKQNVEKEGPNRAKKEAAPEYEVLEQSIEEKRRREADDQRKAVILRYLDDLRSEYQNISAGMYCQDWMVDAVLYTQICAAKERGIKVDCNVQGYPCGAVSQERLAQLLYSLFEFGMQENEKLQEQAKRYIHVKLQNVLGNLAVCFEVASAGKRSAKKIQKVLAKTNEQIEVEETGTGVQVTILV